MDLKETFPSPEQVKSIFNEVYNNWFLKYRYASSSEDYVELIKEANRIDKMYPFKLCHIMILEMLNIINSYNKGIDDIKEEKSI